jgi:hypothetical protein
MKNNTKENKEKVIFVNLIVEPKIGKQPKRKKLDKGNFELLKYLKNINTIIELIIKDDE